MKIYISKIKDVFSLTDFFQTFTCTIQILQDGIVVDGKDFLEVYGNIDLEKRSLPILGSDSPKDLFRFYDGIKEYTSMEG